LSCALSNLISFDAAYFKTYIIEGRKVFERDKAFRNIWEGGILRGCSLKIRCQISFDSDGRLLYSLLQNYGSIKYWNF